MLQDKELWDLLKEFQDIFVGHKDELGICTFKKHAMDTLSFPFYKMTIDFF